MWKVVLWVTMLWCTMCAMCWPASSFDATRRFSFDNRYSRPDSRINEDLFRRVYFLYKPSKRGENYNIAMAGPQSKRGFSMLARWRPFNTIGKNRGSIREHNNMIAAKPLTDFDIVSAETRALLRPVGQPLRWG